MNFSFDSYVFRARLAPATIVTLPIALTFATWFPDEGPVPGILRATGALVVLSWLASHIARDAGKRFEAQWLRESGHFPTVRFLRHRDQTLNPITRQRYHRKLGALLPEVEIPTEAWEASDPDGADDVYDSCVAFLREKTRDKTRFPLVHAENVWYGFRRNLIGMKPVGLLLAVLGTVACALRAATTWSTGPHPPGAPIAASCVNAFLTAVWIARVTPAWVAQASAAYAERLLAACDELQPPRESASTGCSDL